MEVPWKNVLGGVGAAGATFALTTWLAATIAERAVNNRFETRLETLRGELSRELELQKSELAVWAELRTSILKEMWEGHRDIVRAMTDLVLAVQQHEARDALQELQPAIDAYREMVHKQLYLLSPEATVIAQRFLNLAYEIRSRPLASRGNDNDLKAIRAEFYQHMAQLYGLSRMMPWMARPEDKGGHRKP